MKKLIIFGILLLAFNTIYSQPGPRKHDISPKERLEQLEKLKLLEVLDLDEETSIRFFSRFNEFRAENKKVIDERHTLIFEMESALKKGRDNSQFDYTNHIVQLIDLEKKLISQREEFIASLSDLLTIEQIAKLVVFESKFMKEIRDVLSRRRGKK